MRRRVRLGIADGGVVVVGLFHPTYLGTPVGVRTQLVAVRLRADGSLDPSYGHGGLSVTELTPNGLVISTWTNNAGILIRGGVVTLVATFVTAKTCVAFFTCNPSPPSVLLARRLRPDGPLDARFGVNGISLVPAPEARLFGYSAMDRQGRIVAAGWSDTLQTTVRRFTPTGAADLSFGLAGVAIPLVAPRLPRRRRDRRSRSHPRRPRDHHPGRPRGPDGPHGLRALRAAVGR